MKALFIVGFMGSGKSTFGKNLAEAMSVPFYDLDQVIESKTGMRINEIFDTWGENTFREYEAKELRAFNQIDKPFVLACGGGTPCFYQSMEWMNQHGHTLFLDIPYAEIRNRLEGTEQNRPLYKEHTKEKKVDELHQLYIQRREIYLQAASILGPEAQNMDEVIHMLNS